MRCYNCGEPVQHSWDHKDWTFTRYLCKNTDW